MARFFYEAIDNNGQRIQNVCEAEGQAAAIQLLESVGLSVISIRPDTTSPTDAEVSNRETSIATASTKQEWYQRLESALANSQDLVELLEQVRDELPKPIRRNADDVVRVLRENVGVETFLKREEYAKWLPLILSYRREIPFNRSQLSVWSTMLNRPNSVPFRWLPKMTYPGAIVGLTVLLGLFLLAWVVPVFQEMFRDFGLKLPVPTMALFALADFFNKSMLRVIALAFLAVILWMVLVASRKILASNLHGRMLIGKLAAGTQSSHFSMAKFTETLAALLRFQVPLAESIRAAGVASGQKAFVAYANAWADSITSQGRNSGAGEPTPHSIVRVFPATVEYALRAGEHQQPCIELLERLAASFRVSAEGRESRSAGAMAPLVIFFVGFVVAWGIICLFMPLVSLVTSLSS